MLSFYINAVISVLLFMLTHTNTVNKFSSLVLCRYVAIYNYATTVNNLKQFIYQVMLMIKQWTELNYMVKSVVMHTSEKTKKNIHILNPVK